MKEKLEIILKFSVGAGVLLAFLYVIWCVTNRPELEQNTLVAHILGIIEGFVGALMFYWWGTSQSSRDKTDAKNKHDGTNLK